MVEEICFVYWCLVSISGCGLLWLWVDFRMMVRLLWWLWVMVMMLLWCSVVSVLVVVCCCCNCDVWVCVCFSLDICVCNWVYLRMGVLDLFSLVVILLSILLFCLILWISLIMDWLVWYWVNDCLSSWCVCCGFIWCIRLIVMLYDGVNELCSGKVWVEVRFVILDGLIFGC